jgi:hypothetical protein
MLLLFIDFSASLQVAALEPYYFLILLAIPA